MCWLSRRNHLYILRSHPTDCIYCSAQSFCFWKSKIFFPQVSTWRRQCGYLPRTSWKWPENKTNRVRRHLGDEMFNTVAKSVSGSQCLRSTKFVFLSQEHTDIHNTHKHDFLRTKKIIEEKINISTLDKYCAFIIVNFILYFNKCTILLRADSLSLNCI